MDPVALADSLGFERWWRPRESRFAGRWASTHGLSPSGRVYWNPTTSLYSHALLRGEGQLAEGGPLVVDTGVHTGRSPKDKFLVREPGSEARLWWGTQSVDRRADRFDGLRAKVVSFLDDQDVYVVDAFAGADPAHRLPLRVVTYSPWHALFAKTLFIDPPDASCGSSSRRRSCCTIPPSRLIRRWTGRVRHSSANCTRPAPKC